MSTRELDGTDMGILYLLQADARHRTIEEMGEELNVAPSTIASHLRRLEEDDVIEGYNPKIDYEKTEFDHHYILAGTTSADEATVQNVIDIYGVINVRKLITDREDLSIEVVGDSRESFTESVDQLTDIGVEIDRIELVKRELSRPFDDFGEQFTDEE